MKKPGQPSYENYQKDVDRYKKKFEDTLYDIYHIASDETNIKTIEARIKSYCSFCENSCKNFSLSETRRNRRIKNVNDRFGIRIMLDNELALENVLNRLLAEGYRIISIKDHLLIPNTNYNAVHITLKMRGSEQPFELQLRTEERSKDRLPHDVYKIYGAKGLSSDFDKVKILEDFFRLVRLKFDGSYKKFVEELPECYQLVRDEKTGKEKFSIMPQREVLKKLYPTVVETLGENVFERILDKIFIRGIQENRNLISEEDKKMLNLLFEFAIQTCSRRTNEFVNFATELIENEEK